MGSSNCCLHLDLPIEAILEDRGAGAAGDAKKTMKVLPLEGEGAATALQQPC